MLGGCGGGPDCNKLPDFAGWRAATTRATILDERWESKRREVAEQVVKCRSLRGAPRSVVLRTLGPAGMPDRETPADQRNVWTFYLGPDALDLDDENLRVIFDRSGRATTFTISQS